MHTSKAAFDLLTQQERVWFLAFQEINQWHFVCGILIKLTEPSRKSPELEQQKSIANHLYLKIF